MVTKVDGESHSVDADEKRRIADHVLAHLSLGRPLSKIFKEDAASASLCAEATWYRWVRDDQSLREEVAQAREQGMERLVEEMVEISDDKQEDPQSRRVRVYAREKAAQMLSPKRFGQKLDVTSGGKPIEAPKSVTLIDNRIQSVLMLVQQRKASDAELRALLD